MSVPGCRCRLYGGVVLCQAGRYCELLYLTPDVALDGQTPWRVSGGQ